MQLTFGAILDRNHPDIKNAAPIMSRPSLKPILAKPIEQGGYANTIWGNTAVAKPGDYVVCYGFEQAPDGEIKADLNIVDNTTFHQTYGPKQGSPSYSQLDWNMPRGIFSAYKTASVHGLHLPQKGDEKILSREGEATIPSEHVVIVNGGGFPYTNLTKRAYQNFRPINDMDLDRNGNIFSKEQIHKSKKRYEELGQRLNAST